MRTRLMIRAASESEVASASGRSSYRWLQGRLLLPCRLLQGWANKKGFSEEGITRFLVLLPRAPVALRRASRQQRVLLVPGHASIRVAAPAPKLARPPREDDVLLVLHH